MTRLTGNHGRLLRKITASGLVPLLFVASLPTAAATAESCQGWKTAKFFETATVDEVSACLSAGEDPNEPDTQGRTALHRAARETRDPAVIEALLDAGANPRSISIAGEQRLAAGRGHHQRAGHARAAAAHQHPGQLTHFERRQHDGHHQRQEDEQPAHHLHGAFNAGDL